MDRISIRDAILREVASNILIHREYRNAFPAKLIIERGLVRTENSNKPHGFGTLNPATFTPFPKNPVIAAFFREIHRADELGSGMRNMMKYGKAYGGEDPEMIEGDVFRTIVKYPDSTVYEKDSTATAGVTPEVTPEVGKMLTVIQGEMSRAEIQQKLGLTDEKHFREHYQQPAVAMELIEMTIPDKPRSRLQKYRLTDAGKRLLKSMQE
jgi:ATP-dependent DNA helicase RecG